MPGRHFGLQTLFSSWPGLREEGPARAWVRPLSVLLESRPALFDGCGFHPSLKHAHAPGGLLLRTWGVWVVFL